MIVSIDPSSTYTGIAWRTPEAVRLFRVRMHPGDPERSYIERLTEHLPNGRPGDIMRPEHVLVEEVPDNARKDAGRSGQQAVIGRSVAYVAGIMVARYLDHRVPVTRIQPREWRESMLIWAARRGQLLEKPSRSKRVIPPEQVGRNRVTGTQRIGPGRFRLTFECGHSEDVDYAQLGESRDCKACIIRPERTMDDAEWIRDEWKRIACAVVERHWPEPYAALVSEARATARTHKPDHRLEGVSDACEALCIGLHHDVTGKP